MIADSRLSRMLHLLLHMARHEHAFTSEQLAGMLSANPALVRRTMAGLRNAGYVRSEKGRTGGWYISCDLNTTTLDDIYQAVGQPRLIAIGAIGSTTHPDCAVERAVMNVLGRTFEDAENLIRARFKHLSLADVLRDFDAICVEENFNYAKNENEA